MQQILMKPEMPTETRFKVNGLSDFEIATLAKLIVKYEDDKDVVEDLSPLEAGIIVKIMAGDSHRAILNTMSEGQMDYLLNANK